MRRAGDEVARRKRIEREQRLAQARRGSTLRRGAAIVAVVALVFGTIALYRSPILTVHRYRLVGAKQLKLERVLANAKVPADATLIRFPSAEVRRRIAADPWVASVTVHRRLPDTIEFDVVERVPAALVEAGGARWLVDADAWVIEKRSAEASTLPVVRKIEGLKPSPGNRLSSAMVRNALAVLTGVSGDLRRMVRFVDAPSLDETALLTKDNVDILMGPAEELGKKDAIARQILAAQRGTVVFIDVRSTDRPISRGVGN